MDHEAPSERRCAQLRKRGPMPARPPRRRCASARWPLVRASG